MSTRPPAPPGSGSDDGDKTGTPGAKARRAERNAYAPPNTPLTPASVPHVRRSAPLKAVVYGTVVDLAGSLLSVTLIALMFALVLMPQLEANSQANLRLLLDNRIYLVLSGVAGLLMSFVGGMVCGHFAREKAFGCGAAQIVLVALLAEIMVGGQAVPGGFAGHLALTMSSAALTAIGVHLAHRRYLRSLEPAAMTA